MKRGTRAGTPKIGPIEKVGVTWGPDVPDWVMALAEACAREPQGTVGKRIGYAGSTVSLVLSNTYTGDLPALAQMVRGALMAETVDCPVLGEIGRDQCRREQKTPFRATNSTRARLYRACKACPNREVTP